MDADVVRAVNDLTARWVRELPAGNSVLSGLGLWPLLAILATAADEPGRAELAAATGLDPDTSARSAAGLVATLDDSHDLHAALGVWIHERLKLAETFDDVVPAPVRGVLTGDTGRDKAMLDAWASEHTDGLIPEMPVDVTPDLALVLASALSLRTTWALPFEEHPRQLYDGPWVGTTYQWLSRSDGDLDSVRVYDDPAAGPLTIVTVRGDADVDVQVALGSPTAGRADVLAGLVTAGDRGTPGSTLLRQAEIGAELGPGLAVRSSSGARPDVHLSLPAYAVQAEHDLLRHADLFGLTAVSATPRPPGHFSRISPEALLVSQARQSVLARFYATGFEAAAVTAIGMRLASAPVEPAKRLALDIDRPFAFTATHRPTALPLATGWIQTPT